MNDRKELIVNNDHYSLWFYPDLKIVHSQFLKYTGGESFKEVLSKGIEVFIENHCVK